MNTLVGCPIPGASQPKDPVRLVDANGILLGWHERLWL